MQAVRGYEEKDPATTARLTSGYPRFVLHPLVRELTAHQEAGRPELGGRTLWLTSSAAMARALLDYLAAVPDAAPAAWADGPLTGVTHARRPEIGALAKAFLQHVGGFLSSRAAEDALVARGRRPAVAPEPAVTADAPAVVTAALRRIVPEAGPDDLVVTSCGMSAVYAAFQAIAAEQAPRHRRIWVQLGWLYLDTIAILRKLTGGPENYVRLGDVFDLAALAKLCAASGHLIAGVVAEVPTNPLLQTPDLPRLSGLCREHGIRLLLDPSVAGLSNLRLLPFADLVVASLTKYTASEGDLVAGLVVVNPAGPAAAGLRRRVVALAEPPYPRDLGRLAWEIRETGDVVAAIQQRTHAVVEFLSGHPAVRDVFWALHPRSRENYLRLARTPDAVGGLVTFTLRGPLRAVLRPARPAEGTELRDEDDPDLSLPLPRAL